MDVAKAQFSSFSLSFRQERKEKTERIKQNSKYDALAHLPESRSTGAAFLLSKKWRYATFSRFPWPPCAYGTAGEPWKEALAAHGLCGFASLVAKSD
ncbi:MAG: hypothetical protein ACI4NL_08170 [Christensenellales bacterium]